MNARLVMDLWVFLWFLIGLWGYDRTMIKLCGSRAKYQERIFAGQTLYGWFDPFVMSMLGPMMVFISSDLWLDFMRRVYEKASGNKPPKP